MTEEPDERTPPRLQDATERDALPLPLPGGDQPAEHAPAADEPAPIDKPAPIDEPATIAGGEEPISEEPASEPEPAPATSGNGAEPEIEAGEPSPPPFQPAPSVAGLAAEDEGLPTEVLVGAAFLGGVALAILIRRLGN
jgi:hypothetical protein